MPFKDIDKRRKYRREWYSKNKDSEKEHVKKRKNQLKKWFRGYKRNMFCSICLEKHPAIIEFHHKNPHKKEKNIGLMVNDGFSKKKILEEIKKCQVLCANCHRKKHYKNNKL